MSTVEIPTICEIELNNPEQIQQMTKANGDRITIVGIHFTPKQGAALSYLINGDKSLIVEIKEA